MNGIMATFAFVILVGFLSILIIHVPRLDLILVIGFTLALSGWDLISTIRARRG
jgi:hypothetical protein